MLWKKTCKELPVNCQRWRVIEMLKLQNFFSCRHGSNVPSGASSKSDMNFLIHLWAEDYFKSKRIDTLQMTVHIFGETDSLFTNYVLTSVDRHRRFFSVRLLLKQF